MTVAVDSCLRDCMLTAVDHIMRIVHQPDDISACLQHIAAAAFTVKRSHILFQEGDRQNLGFAWLQQFCLRKTSKNHMSLFYSAFGVRGGIIDLCHILTCHTAGIGDLYLHGDACSAVHKVLDALFEGGIAQAVAERILHYAVIVDKPVRCGRFIVTITDIDALSVLHIVPLQVGVSKAACIVVRRGSREIIGIRICQTAGGVYRAGQHIAYRVEADSAGAPNPQAGVNAIFHKAKLHGIGRVDQDNDLFIILCLDKGNQIFLVLR